MLVDSSKTSWREELGLGVFRAQETPALKRDKKRLRAYQAGLTQSEEFWKAADGLTTLSSPVLRFYALLQASSSVIAASTLGHDQWQPRGGHGLTLTGVPQKGNVLPELGGVTVKPNGDGTPQALAKALGSSFVAEEVNLEDLITALPEQSLLRRAPGRRLPAYVQVQSSSVPGPLVVITGTLDDNYLSQFDPGREEIPQEAIRASFENYPSLKTFPSWDRAVVASRYLG